MSGAADLDLSPDPVSLQDGPPDEAAQGPEASEASLRREQALARLMDKLQRQPDFPSLGDALSQVRRVARNERSRLQTLAESLSLDVGLSHRVLRLANAVHYRSVGGGQITTLARAIAVMGFTEVAQLSVASRLIDQLKDRQHSTALREEFLRALLAGVMADALVWRLDLRDEAHLVGVFRNLGRMMACLHFPSEALAVRNAVPRQRWPRRQAEHEASLRLLGVDYGHLGGQVAQRWGWPPGLRQALQHEDWPLRAPTGHAGRLRCLAAAANDLADLLLYVSPQRWDLALDDLHSCAVPATGLGKPALKDALAAGRQQLERLAELLALPLSQLPGWEGAFDPLTTPSAAGRAVPAGVPSVADPAPAAELAGSPRANAAAVPNPLEDLAVAQPIQPGGTSHTADPAMPWLLPQPEALMGGVQQVLDAMAHGTDPAQVQALIVEALLHGLGGRRAVMCLQAEQGVPPNSSAKGADKSADTGPGNSPSFRRGLQGRYGLAHHSDAALEHFDIPSDDASNLFSLLCARGADVVVRDAREPSMAARLPAWWHQHVASPSFVALPMMLGGQPVGMLYVDSDRPGGLVIDDQDMKLVRLLRSQAVMAWKQGG